MVRQDFLLFSESPHVRLPEPVFRLAESEWKAFVEHFTDMLVDADPQIPHLPPKDVIHRIYRDVSCAIASWRPYFLHIQT